MLISFPTFLSCLLLVGSACAQVNASNCTEDTFAWTFNSLQQNPCLVGAYLAAACNNGLFTVPTLLPGYSYTRPNGIDAGDICKCNTVFYNLISACDACQGAGWNPYSVWMVNCTSKATPGNFPKPVPAGTRVPKWAYIDTSIGNSWNFSVAQLEGDFPKVMGTSSIIPTSTTKTFQSVTSSSTLASNHSSNAGAIVGGIVGSIAGALIIRIVLWFVLRCRRARSVPSAPVDSQGEAKEQPTQESTPPSLAQGAPKLYDPSDPTTYPSKDYILVSNHHPSSTSLMQPSNAAYTGLPEV